MVFTAQAAVKRARASKFNTPGTCQLWTRGQYGAASAGDVDHDGDADAVDGWKSEPVSARHTNRRPPLGAPVAWSGGRSGFGHRAISLGPIDGVYMIRSTDAAGSGRVGTVPLRWVEDNWGLKYEGWSETISGQKILGLDLREKPEPKPEPEPKPKTSRGPRIDAALDELSVSLKNSKNRNRRLYIRLAIAVLEKIPMIK
jgi:hypothetical protein